MSEIEYTEYVNKIKAGICPYCGAKGRIDEIDDPNSDEFFCDACGESLIKVDYSGLKKDA